jgi:hypothetical protein
LTDHRSARVNEYMRLKSCGANDGAFDALLRSMDDHELSTLAKSLVDKRTVSTPGEFTAKAACVIIGYEITLEIVEHVLGHTHAAFWVSVAITLGIIYAALRFEERERRQRINLFLYVLKGQQQRARAPSA